ncbi:DMT family transporter [Leifsonia sp. F6_8S_P_1B]|uniref:DMT family transporter n=1 Tax=Leifsonia williamsii TaxID=3035919 RepID=A0ABT8K920_9MICO|nr:DMT family transporter [Leifsonia williamsii]MDN4613959.1 DMT family transporter [Leifsonia williamsii]
MLHRLRAIRFSRQELALIAITALWGATFLIVHLAMQHSGPWFFVGLRFLVAGLLSAALFHRALRGMRWRDLGAGATIGVTITLGYGLQTHGLQTVSSSTSAFITAIYVPLVPLLQWIVLRRAPRALTLVGVALAFLGLLLLAGPDAVRIGLGEGEVVTLISTLPIAAEIILISAFARIADVRRVTVVQLLVAGVLGFAVMPLVGEAAPAFSWAWLLPAVGLGVASCVIQLTMNWAQRSVSPTRATIIYAGEPVWGGIIGRLAGDRLPLVAVFGAALIVAGVIVSELQPKKRRAEASAGRPLPDSADPAYGRGMPTYTATRPLDGDADLYFDYISNPENLPAYFPRMTQAHELPDGKVETTAQVDVDRDGEDETVTSEAEFDVDNAAREVRWSAPGPHEYHGALRLTDDAAELTIHTTHEHDGIQEALEESLESIARNLREQV